MLFRSTANIEYDEKRINIDDLNKFVEKAGFKSLGISNLQREQKKNKSEKINLALISILSILNIYISMAHMIGLPTIYYISMVEYPINYTMCLCILTTLVLILGYRILLNGIKNLIHGTPNMDTLVTIGVVASYIYSLFGTAMIIKGETSYVENLYYESAAIVIFFIEIGKFIENKNKNKTKEALQKLMTITPKDAVIERDGKELTVTIDEIQKGDIVDRKSTRLNSSH